jgi:hypothetical protein
MPWTFASLLVPAIESSFAIEAPGSGNADVLRALRKCRNDEAPKIITLKSLAAFLRRR